MNKNSEYYPPFFKESGPDQLKVTSVIYIDDHIAKCSYLNWTEKVLITLLLAGHSDKNILATMIGQKHPEAVNNMKRSILKKYEAIRKQYDKNLNADAGRQ